MATGPGEAGGSSGAGGYYGDDFGGAGTLSLNDPVTINGVLYLGGNEGGMLFGYVNSASLPLATDPRQFRPAEFLGIRTNSGGDGHSVDIQIGSTVNGSPQLDVTAFQRPEGSAGGPLFNSVSPFSFTYDPGSAGGPDFGSVSLFVGGATAADGDGGETFTMDFDASNRPDPTGISFDRLAMFGAEGQTAAFDDLTYTSAVPEPASLGLVGAAGLMLMRRRRSA